MNENAKVKVHGYNTCYNIEHKTRLRTGRETSRRRCRTLRSYRHLDLLCGWYITRRCRWSGCYAGLSLSLSLPISILPKYVEVPRRPRAIPRFLDDVLAQACFETRLLVDELTELIFGKLQQGAKTRGRDQLRTANEALPQWRVRPNLLGDKAGEECGRDEADK